MTLGASHQAVVPSPLDGAFLSVHMTFHVERNSLPKLGRAQLTCRAVLQLARSVHSHESQSVTAALSLTDQNLWQPRAPELP